MPIVYACGPEGMMKAAVNVTAQVEAPCFVSMERIMGCGLGGCYSCVVPMRTDQGGFHHVRSCLSGPVMPGHQIVWDAAVPNRKVAP
jgi:dihydroorotate dehydrogenase electron transfer subunit